MWVRAWGQGAATAGQPVGSPAAGAQPASRLKKEACTPLLPSVTLLPTTPSLLQVVDTCDDSDCSGCCSKNANRNGGFLIDLEYHTAKRFWGARINGMAVIEWQEI